MPTKYTRLPKRVTWPVRCVLFLLAASIWPGSLAASTSVQASKDCFTTPCTVMEAQFTLHFAQTIQWQATYQGTGPPNAAGFYLSTVRSDVADTTLALITSMPTSGQYSGGFLLQSGTYPVTYFISIKTNLMGPGIYTVTYNPALHGDPHITTIDGMHYDFQSAGGICLAAPS